MNRLPTDRERVLEWNDLCITRGWARPGELQVWLYEHSVRFTPSDSILSPDGFLIKIATKEAASELAGGEAEMMATHVLSVFCGQIIFASTDIEASFWKVVINRMSSEFDTFMPVELVPVYIREILKYPAEGDDKAAT